MTLHCLDSSCELCMSVFKVSSKLALSTSVDLRDPKSQMVSVLTLYLVRLHLGIMVGKSSDPTILCATNLRPLPLLTG